MLGKEFKGHRLGLPIGLHGVNRKSLSLSLPHRSHFLERSDLRYMFVKMHHVQSLVKRLDQRYCVRYSMQLGSLRDAMKCIDMHLGGYIYSLYVGPLS